MLTLRTLKSTKGAHKNIKRIGRGQGSGQGTQAGKGHKGQKARTRRHSSWFRRWPNATLQTSTKSRFF